jgi:hypothetical protein
MIRKLAWMMIAGLAVTGSAVLAQTDPPAATTTAAALPKAETILDHFVEVTGGKAAYEARKGEIATGTFSLAAQGIKGAMTQYSAPPDKSYVVVDLDGIGKIESGTGDGIAWDKNAMTGPRLKSGDEKAESLRDAAFNGSVDWRSLYPNVETLGVETIDGEECYKVQLSPPTGKPITSYYQKKSGLLVKRVMTAVTAMGEVPAEVAVSDYKKFGDVLSPTKIVQKAAGQEVMISIDTIKNEEIPADKFDPPAEIKALLKK